MSSTDGRLRRGKDYIDRAFAERISVADVAAVAELSPGYFSREFRRVFGTPPHQYLMARRMEHAAALLRMTDRPVAEVCRAVGLRSVGSFTTAFTHAFGLSPGAYRRRP